MPIDGIVLKTITYELNDKLAGGRIEKVFQPENDEIVLNVRSKGNSYKLLISANPSLPRVHLTEHRKFNPTFAPNFCMVLRKHVQGAKILEISTLEFERILNIDIEYYNELQVKQIKRLVVEIMGKHSNIILLNESGRIIDAIKHIDNDISSIREIMPARLYTLPPSHDKLSPEGLDVDKLFANYKECNSKISQYLVDTIMGFSPFLSKIICNFANLEPNLILSSLNADELTYLKINISRFLKRFLAHDFSPCVVFKDSTLETPYDFYCFDFKYFKNVKRLSSINEAADSYYFSKDHFERLNSRKSELLRSLNTAIERTDKKIQIYNENLVEVSGRETYKLYGDLILAFIHSIPKNADKITLTNFYSENCEDIEIPLDPTITPQATAAIYYKKYTKCKNTFEKCTGLIQEAKSELSYLENVHFSLLNSQTAEEIIDIKHEMTDNGIYFSKYIGKSKGKAKKQQPSFAPLIFKSSDGYKISVGKNNYQNDRLTLKEAYSNDIWLHTKDIAGSHVIIKKQQDSIPESTIYEAAMLAAFYSKARQSSGVPVDYTIVKHVKKPSGSKPGMVIYTHNKTLYVTPDENFINKLKYSEKDVSDNDIKEN